MDPEMVTEQREVYCDLTINDLINRLLDLRGMSSDELREHQDELFDAHDLINEAINRSMSDE